MWDYQVYQSLPCYVSSLLQLPNSASPTSLDECFLFGCQTSIQLNFLTVLVVLVFKFVVILVLVVQGSQVYLPMPLSWPEV